MHAARTQASLPRPPRMPHARRTRLHHCGAAPQLEHHAMRPLRLSHGGAVASHKEEVAVPPALEQRRAAARHIRAKRGRRDLDGLGGQRVLGGLGLRRGRRDRRDRHRCVPRCHQAPPVLLRLLHSRREARGCNHRGTIPEGVIWRPAAAAKGVIWRPAAAAAAEGVDHRRLRGCGSRKMDSGVWRWGLFSNRRWSGLRGHWGGFDLVHGHSRLRRARRRAGILA